MPSIAELGIKVDSTDAAQASSDLDKLTAAGGRAEKAAEGVARGADKASKAIKSQADELADLLGEIDPTVKALGRLDELETKLSKHKGVGLDAATFSEYQAKIDQSRANLTRFDDSLSRTGNTAKQTAAALRTVPSQFTDIVTSLQGGQAPLTVLLQQGGQLKDSFGGIGAAAKAMGGYVLGLVNPFTVAAAAAAALTVAYYKGSEEADEYNKALVLTGNYAGSSASELADMARQVSVTVGTTGAAATVLAQLAGSGKIASGSFQEITEAALEMEKATGKAVEATVAEFVKIADDPVAAAKSLNDQYHFLTASVYSQIVALKEQGDTVGAVKLLTDTYASTVSTRAGEITKNLGLIERGWNAIKGAAAGALDATLNVGREQTLEQQIAALQKRINTPSSYDAIPIIGEDNPDLTKTGSTKEQDQSHLSFLLLQRDAEASKNKYVADRARVEQEAILATDRADARHLATLSNAEKRALEIKKINEDTEKIRAANPNDKRVSAEYVAQQIKDVNDKYKDAKGPANQLDLTAFNDAQNQLKALTATYSNSQKELDAQQKAGIISQESYAAQRAALIQAEKEEVTNAYQAEISALEATRDKTSTTAQQRIQLDQKIADARTSMVKAQQDADTELSVLATNEEGRLAKQALAVKTYTDALQQQVVTLRQQGQRSAATLGLGDRQRSLFDSQNSIDDRFNQQKVELANQYGDGSRGMSLDEYTQKLKALQTTQQDLRDTVTSNFDAMTAAQSDWTAGATSAWQNYQDNAQNVAGQMKTAFTNLFDGLTDSVVDWAFGADESFGVVLLSFGKMIAKMELQAAASSVFSGSSNGSGGLLSTIGSSIFSSFTGSSASSAGSTQAGYSSTYFPQGRATGGDVSPNTLYQVNENGPELYSQGGKTFLMTGEGGGSVTPLTNGSAGLAAGGGGSSPIAVSIQISGDGTSQVSSNTSGMEQFGAEIGRFVEARYKQLEAKSLGPQGNIRKAINGRA